MAEDLRAYGIRVSVICPGTVATEFSPHTGKDVAKMLEAEDVAHVVAALVTQSAQSFISEVLIRPTQKTYAGSFLPPRSWRGIPRRPLPYGKPSGKSQRKTQLCGCHSPSKEYYLSIAARG